LKLLQASSFVAKSFTSFSFLQNTHPPEKQTKHKIQATPRKKKNPPSFTQKKNEAQEALRLSLLSRPTQKKTNNKSEEAKRVHLGARVHFASAHRKSG
jgi:hypothetical protein